MKTRFLLSAAAFLTVLVAAIPLAHAGGASGATLDTSSTTACRTILSGGSAGQIMTLTVNGVSQDLQVGAPVYLCDIPLDKGALKKGTELLVPCSAPDTPTGCNYTPSPGLVVCYALSGANKTKIGAALTTPFGEEGTQVGGLGLVCVTANVQ
jgi:hypothetical protein